MSETNRMLKYFWQEKRNLERWVNWSEATDIPPEVKKTWNDFKTAEKILDAVINNLQEGDP